MALVKLEVLDMVNGVQKVVHSSVCEIPDDIQQEHTLSVVMAEEGDHLMAFIDEREIDRGNDISGDTLAKLAKIMNWKYEWYMVRSEWFDVYAGRPFSNGSVLGYLVASTVDSRVIGK